MHDGALHGISLMRRLEREIADAEAVRERLLGEGLERSTYFAINEHQLHLLLGELELNGRDTSRPPVEEPVFVPTEEATQAAEVAMDLLLRVPGALRAFVGLRPFYIDVLPPGEGRKEPEPCLRLVAAERGATVPLRTHFSPDEEGWVAFLATVKGRVCP